MKNIEQAGVILAVFLLLGGYLYAQDQSDALAPSSIKTQSTATEQAGAQQQSGARKSPTSDDVVQKMKTDLNLTQAQVDAIKPIIEQDMAKRKKLLDGLKQQGASEDTLRTQTAQLNQERDQQLSKILTPDQMDKLKDIKTKKHHKSEKKHRVEHRAGELDSN
jgi:Spy/CpxP family protein refolding chaperone